MRQEISNYENINPYNKRYKYNFKVFIAIFSAITIFVTGITIGGAISYGQTSSQINGLQNQINGLQIQDKNTVTKNLNYIIDNTSLSNIYEQVKDSVVVIQGQISQNTFFGTQYGEVQGSGFVYNEDGEKVVITNYHVVHQAEDITVELSNGNTYPASVLGSDPYSDLAILQVDAPQNELKPLEIVSSSTLKVGDYVIAIGSPYGLGGTMTTGIVSQLGRTIQESLAGSFPIANIIQTSVPINPGNSGGPLLDYEGSVVGITTAIIQNSNGLGFSIPSDTILHEIDALVKTGLYDQHPWLGISGADMNYLIAKYLDVNITYGWIISSTTNNGAAKQAGLKGGTNQVRIGDTYVVVGGDIIVAIDNYKILNGDSMMSYLEEHTIPGQEITITIYRDHQFMDINLKLDSRPPIN